MFSLDLLIIFYSSLLKHTKSQSTHIRHTPHTHCMEPQKSILAKLLYSYRETLKLITSPAADDKFFIASSAEMRLTLSEGTDLSRDMYVYIHKICIIYRTKKRKYTKCDGVKSLISYLV